MTRWIQMLRMRTRSYDISTEPMVLTDLACFVSTDI